MQYNNTSQLFLSDMTVVDHAYVDNQGIVVGGSFNPSFLVEGKVDPVENVVVDFSRIKKDIKNIVDANEDGFDHKLWFIPGWSKGTIEVTLDGNCHIVTTTTDLVMPQNAVKVVEGISEYSTNLIGVAMGNFVTAKLQILYPQVDISVECINSTKQHQPDNIPSGALFRYVHGLKNSSSWGCQNHSHGHLSFLRLLAEKPSYSETTKYETTAVLSLQSTIAHALDNTLFVFKDNITSDTSSVLTIGYTTERGTFLAQYSKADYKIVVLETETTVEHLVEYVKTQFAQELKQAKVAYILMSEGLSKGAASSVQHL